VFGTETGRLRSSVTPEQLSKQQQEYETWPDHQYEKTNRENRMTKLQKTLIAVAIGAAIGTAIYQAHQNSQLHDRVITLTRQQASVAEQIQQLTRERDEAKSRLTTRDDAVANAKGNSTEVLKLRGEVARLRGEANQANDPFVQSALQWRAKMEKLQRLFEERPGQRIPEMQFLTEEQWLDLGKDADMDTEFGIGVALSNVRFAAQQAFAPTFQNALNKFKEANKGDLPDSIAKLNPFFDSPVDDAILERYEVLGKEVPREGWLKGMVLIEKGLADQPREAIFVIGPNRTGYAPHETKHAILPK
jgi:hypothetical protein